MPLLRVFLGLSVEVRQAVIHLIAALTAQDEPERRRVRD
jgi:hypothetical protein